MSGRQGQSFTSWLMMVPLLVVPLVAVFGVPKLDQLYMANAEGEEPDLELEQGQETPFDQSMPPMPAEQMNLGTSSSSSPNTAFANGQPANAGWANPFDTPEGISSPASSERANSPDRANNAGDYIDPFSTDLKQDSSQLIAANNARSGNQGDPIAAGSVGYTRSSKESNERVFPTNSGTASQPAPISHWRKAVSRLNQLGVQKYQLSQTEESFVFLFACDLTHPDNPRITHRFQAEASEPLQAVTKVIQQVETWSAQINNR
ncbi:MAG: hypothetical protein P8M30_14325 [Planctomycetaceae bacterium]|jgi:hypothetical protein|nr:hypothetical protein [Planctomycetaceae bacterium]